MRTVTMAIVILGTAALAAVTGERGDHAPARATAERGAQPPAEAPAADYPIRAVPLTDVRFTDTFWRPRLERNATITIPHIVRENETTGRVANFQKAAKQQPGAHQGQRYNDTDVYKVIEAASYVLAATPDPALDKQLDDLIAVIAAAQEPDGYLYTPRTIDPSKPAPGAGPERWSYLHTSHELYNAGHLYEAAVAHVQATGKRTLLDVAIKNADLVCRTFGPEARRDAPGHQEIELALVKLFRVTGDRKYLDQARFFLEQRGRTHSVAPVTFGEKDRFAIYNDPAYRQDHRPVVEQTRAVGHAVRATYMFAGMTDVATLLGDAPYARTLREVYGDITSTRMYVTGGLGSQGRTEAFGDDYVLPNRQAYAETCASIGGILWYHRMFLREGDGAFIDVLERTLYNGYLAGVSLGGASFFYQNPLESDGKVERSAYFDVACCPANLARLMAQLPGLVYAQRDDELFVNLFVASDATVKIGGAAVRLGQRTYYPWQGGVSLRLELDRPAEFTVSVRIPEWARGEPMDGGLYRFAVAAPDRPTVLVNRRSIPLTIEKGYVRIRRQWESGDRVEFDLPMPVRRVLANDAVEENRGKTALQRGPLVYCVEAIDHGGRVQGLTLPLDAALGHEFRSDLLGGVEVITGTARGRAGQGPARDQPLVAVPYFAWANRTKGEMVVWIPSRP